MEDMNKTIEEQNRRELEVVAEAKARIESMTSAIIEQQRRISVLEAQVKQLRGVLKAINRSAFDALGVAAELDRKEVQG